MKKTKKPTKRIHRFLLTVTDDCLPSPLSKEEIRQLVRGILNGNLTAGLKAVVKTVIYNANEDSFNF